MTGLISSLLAWLALCLWAGFARRFVAFFGILLGGLALNALWMVFGLGVAPFEPNALLAQMAAVLYALVAGFVGWFAGRIQRAWRDSKANP